MIRKFIKEFNNAKHSEFVKRELDVKEFVDLDGDYYRAFTYGDELELPVFHLVDVNINDDICICLFEPRYYQYTHNTCTYMRLLVDELDKFLREPNIRFTNMTNWEALVDKWKVDHSLPDRYKNAKQPDYRKLEDSKIIRRSFARMLAAKWNA